MITAFQIADKTARGPGSMFRIFRRNRIRVEHLYCDAAAVKSITYECFRGRVNWTTVDRFIPSKRALILCREGTGLPAERGYRRFVSDELRTRLCENTAMYLMNNIEEPNVRVALIDDNGDHTALCGCLADNTDSLCVITRKPRLYLDEAERLLEEKGAAIRVSKSLSPLKTADLIIAPARLERDLHCAGDAVILSASEPAVAQNAPVIFDYSIDLPEKFRAVKPDFLDELYFASAMYTLAGAHELGSSIFRRCSDGSVIHTRASLLQCLKKRLHALT